MMGYGVTSDRLSDSIKAYRVAVYHHDASALRNAKFGYCLSDTRCRAGDYCDPS